MENIFYERNSKDDLIKDVRISNKEYITLWHSHSIVQSRFARVAKKKIRMRSRDLSRELIFSLNSHPTFVDNYWNVPFTE